MKLHFVFLFLLLTITVIHTRAQRQPDSSTYYKNVSRQVYREYMDSLNKDPRYREAQDYLGRLRQKRSSSSDYFSIALFTQLYSGNYDQFNQYFEPMGFSTMSGINSSIGYGFSWKKRFSHWDFNLVAFPIGKKVTKGEEYIKASFGTTLQLEWGYDFVKSKMFNLYPFIGLGLRMSGFDYHTPKQINSNPSNILDIVLTDRSFEDTKTRVGYQAGLAVETVLTKASQAGGVILFAKIGTNKAFKEKAFNFYGYYYDPKFEFAKWTATIGFKFFGRK